MRMPAGDNAVLIDLGEVSAQELHAAAARAEGPCIVGHSSLYVFLNQVGRMGRMGQMGRMRTVPVSFDGPDLSEFLERTHLSLDAFLSRVASLRLTVRYIGFRGGFGYLDGWPAEWAMPRRPTSRPHVPRGTFAIAGAVAGFYPIDSPGGWNLLGRTNEDLEHALSPGDVIVIAERRPLAGRVAGGPPARTIESARFEVLSAPLATVVHDPDYSGLDRGIPPGGPYDDIAAALAKRAVERCELLIECAMTGPRLRFRIDSVAAWCGPDLDVRIHRMRAGEELAIGRITGGLRGYLAVGDGAGVIDKAQRNERLVIHAIAGPHETGLEEVECEVTPRLDRVGIHLRPLRDLGIAAPADLRSIGMQFGTIQLHPDGSLVAMGPEHPVTGGYLQPMTVPTYERWKLAQLTPGERVRFVSRRTDSPSAQPREARGS